MLEGGCTCGLVRYRVTAEPLIVHGCHCRRCQNQTGAAYAINALLEDHRVELVSGTVQDVAVDTPSGRGQTITRCTRCQVAVWSRYHALPRVGERVLFVRVGTLDDPDAIEPGVHIQTSTKRRHVRLPEGARVHEGFYDVRKVWSPASLGRYAALASAEHRESGAETAASASGSSG